MVANVVPCQAPLKLGLLLVIATGTLLQNLAKILSRNTHNTGAIWYAPISPFSHYHRHSAIHSTPVSSRVKKSFELVDNRARLTTTWSSTRQARLRRQFVLELRRKGLGVPGAQEAAVAAGSCRRRRSPSGISLKERVFHRYMYIHASSCLVFVSCACLRFLTEIRN